jgi:hypothetical protein
MVTVRPYQHALPVVGAKGHKTKVGYQCHRQGVVLLRRHMGRGRDGCRRDSELRTGDMAPEPQFDLYHNRQSLILECNEYAAWLEGPETATALSHRSARRVHD